MSSILTGARRVEDGAILRSLDEHAAQHRTPSEWVRHFVWTRHQSGSV